MPELSPLMARYEEVLSDSLGLACVRLDRGLTFVWRDLHVALVDPGSFDTAYLEIYAPVPVREDAGNDVPSAMNATNRACKGICVFAVDDSVVFTVRGVVAAPSALPDRGHLVAVFPRALSMIASAISRFAEELTLAGIAQFSADSESGA